MMFHQASQPVQYNSVAVYGTAQLESFASLLEEKPPHLRQVRHLLITHEKRSFFSPLRGEPSGRVANESTPQESMLHRTGEYARVTYPLLRRVFSIVQSTLETLALLLPMYYYDVTIPAIPLDLPKLTELVLGGCVRGDCLELSRALPALERLEVVSNDCLPTPFTPLFRRIAPRLTHLCIGDVFGPWECHGPVDAVRTAIDFWSGCSIPEGEDQVWLSRLQKFVIGRCPIYRGGKCGSTSMTYDYVTQLLYDTAAGDTSNRLALLPPPPPYSKRYTHEAHYARVLRGVWDQWIDRLAGGEGRWGTAKAPIPWENEEG